ncbi:dihydrofolate reductase family protein [Microbacterium sp. SORGH_AS_0862]|uniref:dihydrofolate reductase family protein n=1 Tax=Microbacterium sp. SORGH_AS_0862 TaxID=3041789 RepID=UPI00279398A3|nr:dihydrofolate reductase family protein [Microbacterium sp. SORGH_AS_0862]MDQ1206939.1 dihydrofolate reductase [Microbacterium sp. SORGH_AS_0862]
MVRYVYCTASTLDGFLADDADSLDWLLNVPGGDGASAFATFLDGVGALVMGSTTFDWVHRHENLHDHPERWRSAYAERPAFVFSSRQVAPVTGADIRHVHGTVSSHLADIEAAAAGRDVWIVGGGDLAGQFADIGRLDRIIVTYAPATLGSGRPLLPRRLDSARLRVEEAAMDGPFAQVTLSVSP